RGPAGRGRRKAGVAAGPPPRPPPPPAGPPPERRRTPRPPRPAREPCLTGLPPGEMSPPLFEWPRSRERLRIGTGRGAVPGTAARLRGAGPPESACVLGAARLGAGGPGPRLRPVAKPGRWGTAFAPAAVHPEPRRKNASPFQGRGIIVS